MFQSPATLLVVAILGFGCAAEAEPVDSPVLSIDNVVERAAIGASACSAAVGLTKVCPKGFAPFSEVAGIDPLACDACVPLPAVGDPEPECYFDAECPEKSHCEVDMVACPQPSYCAGCWGGCTDAGLTCTSCIDCACGGTCVPD